MSTGRARTTVTVQGASAATSPETLPSSLRRSDWPPRAEHDVVHRGWRWRIRGSPPPGSRLPARGRWRGLPAGRSGCAQWRSSASALRVLVAAFGVQRAVEHDAVGPQHVEAGDARAGQGGEDPARPRRATLGERRPAARTGPRRPPGWARRPTARAGSRRRRWKRGCASGWKRRRSTSAKPSRRSLAARGGERHPIRVAEVEGELRRGRVAPFGQHLEAAQDHLLQPGRAVRAQAPRRRGVAPQPPLQPGQALRIAEGADVPVVKK